MPLAYLNTVFLLVLASCTVCSLFQLCSVRAPESRRTLIRLHLQSNYLLSFLFILCKTSGLPEDSE